MTSVAEARAEIRRRTRPLAVESVPLAEAHGRALREAVAAPEDMPPFDRSAMDGYAVRDDDPALEFKVRGEVRAGDSEDLHVQPGEAVRIFTGARLPAPGLKVVMQEEVQLEGAVIRLQRRSEETHVRRRGEDARAGEVLLQPGQRLEATAIGLLASLGKISLAVTRPPRLLHLTTGDEIVPPGQPLGPGKIRNSNAFLIGALGLEWCGEAVAHLHAPDNVQTMTALLSEVAAADYDLVMISGGSGQGKYDYGAELFRHLGAEILFRQLDLRPGKPLMFGVSPSQIVFGLPGNALSHYVCFHLFVRHALGALLGCVEEATQVGFLAEALPDPLNARETWWPARIDLKKGRLELSPLPWKSSGDITRLGGAGALLRIPANTKKLRAGAEVDFFSTRSAFSP